MSIIRKLEYLFLFVLIVCLVLMGWRNHSLSNRVNELQTKQAPVVATAKAATTKATAVQDAYTERDKSNALLHAALEANPTYSAEPVPADIAARLRSPDGTAERVP